MIEIELAWPGSSAAEILSTYESGYARLMTPVDSKWLKVSHRYLRNSPSFEKTRSDIRILNNSLCLPDFDCDKRNAPWWFERRERETYDYGHPNLNVSKSDFFRSEGELNYVYDHDSIHLSMARLLSPNGRPAYELYKSDSAEVMCDRAKWDDLPWSTKLRGVVEEAMVLAIERSLVPRPGVLTPKAAYEMALEKVASSITSGWFREFAWENLDAARGYLAGEPESYFDWFKSDVSSGLVKKCPPPLRPMSGDPNDPEDVYSVQDWESMTSSGLIISYDGSGYWGVAGKGYSWDHSCWDEKPEWADVVVWFNK
jgi:hypothetical protein